MLTRAAAARCWAVCTALRIVCVILVLALQGLACSQVATRRGLARRVGALVSAVAHHEGSRIRRSAAALAALAPAQSYIDCKLGT